jgi:hypothetical protein
MIFMRQAWQPANHFEKLFEATCPNHTYPVRQKLKECTMMKNYMTSGTFARGKKPKDDSTGKVVAPSLKRRWSCPFMVGRPPTSLDASSNLPVNQPTP